MQGFWKPRLRRCVAHENHSLACVFSANLVFFFKLTCNLIFDYFLRKKGTCIAISS